MAEVIVIGGGIGGLSAGVRLLQRGFSVTLVERQPRVGGYAISYSRAGYLFDLALHVVPSGGSGQEFYVMAKLLGLQLRFIRLTSGFNVFLGDYHFQMPNNYEELFDKLSNNFPAEQDGLLRFRRDLEKYVKCYGPVFDYTVAKLRSLPRFLPKIPAFLKHSNLGAEKYLRRFFTDKRLIAILFQPAAFMGIPMKEFATVNYMMMFYLLMKNGMYTIEGGGQAVTDELADTFRKNGGTLITGIAAQKINISGRKAVSVTLTNGESLGCDAIIAGNNLYDLVNTLIGRSYFSKKYLDNFETLTPSVSVMALNLGIDCKPEDLGISSHISMVFPDSDIDQCFTEQSCGDHVKVKGFSVTAHGVSDPAFVKNDRYGLSIIAGTSPYWVDLEKSSYLREKERVSREMIVETERYFPGLKNHIVVQDFCTPGTMYHYTANPQGAIMGLNCTAGMHRRLITATNIPLTNVVMGSAWTNRLGGFMQSMKSGILAAESI